MNHMLAVSDHLDPTFPFSFLNEILSITLISTFENFQYGTQLIEWNRFAN
jgi:hypothetical protein